MSTATPPKRRDLGRKNAMDMVRSVGLIGLVVACVFWLVPRPDSTYIPSADLTAAAQSARGPGDVPVIVPTMPAGWQVTSARRQGPADGLPATWHIGYLTDSGEYAGVKVTNDATDAWLSSSTVQAENVRTPIDVDGVEWDTWIAAKDARVSLVRGGIGERSVVVGGTAERDDLVKLATAVQQADRG